MAVFATLSMTAGADKTLSWAAAKPSIIFGEGGSAADPDAPPDALIVNLRLLPLNIKL